MKMDAYSPRRHCAFRAPGNPDVNDVPPTPGLGHSWFLPVDVTASDKHSRQPGSTVCTGISSCLPNALGISQDMSQHLHLSMEE